MRTVSLIRAVSCTMVLLASVAFQIADETDKDSFRLTETF
jgi:hypothetical protein